MKVSDAMSTQVDFVTALSSVRDVCKLIFGRGINGVPVLKDKKLIGIITEKDVLDLFYPSMAEYAEDPVHEGDFEAMEKKTQEVFGLSAEKIMSKHVATVKADMPILKAEAIMSMREIGRLPVVDEDNNLIGVIAKGDIFRYLVGENLPLEEDEQFHDWLSKRYDLIIDQDARLSKEIPDLVKLFKKLKVKRILDVGCGTGIHSVALALEGFEIVGIDRSSKMINVAQEKLEYLPKAIRQKLKFLSKNYRNLELLIDKKFDAAIFMGSALAHVEYPQLVLREVDKVLNEKAVIICQIANYDKIIKVNRGVYDVNVVKSPNANELKQAFFRFYDEKNEKGFLTQNLGVFIKGARKWSFKGLRSMKVYPLNKEKATAFIRKVKFSRFKYYGGEKGFFYDHLFSKPFDPRESDVLTIVAER